MYREKLERQMQKLQEKLDAIETGADELEDAKYEKWTSQKMQKVVNLGAWRQ